MIRRLLIRIALLLTVCPVLTAFSAHAHNLGSQPNNLRSDANKPHQQASAPAKQHWSESAQEILMNALSLTGIQYKYGGHSPETGFDCSGFVRYVFQQATNMSLPHNAKAISQVGEVISRDQLKPGDLVFFNTMRSAFSHVGIYLGNNRFIHAPSSGGGVHVVDMNAQYWAKRYDGARRIDPDTTQ